MKIESWQRARAARAAAASLCVISAGVLGACKSGSPGSAPSATATTAANAANPPAGERIAVPGATGPTMTAKPPTTDTAPAGVDPSFAIAVNATPGAVGAATAAVVKATPGTGYHVNLDFPVKLTLEPPAGVSLEKGAFEKADTTAFDKDQLVFTVKATAAAAGEYKIPGTLKFAVCTATTCDPKKVPVEVAVVVK